MQMKRLAGIVFLSLLVCLAVSVQAEGFEAVFDRSREADCLTARFIDLGSPEEGSPGDCTIITSPGGEYVMVVDAGLKTSLSQVMGALNAMNLDHIDYLVVSHPHGDHTGCMPEIMDTFDVRALYTSPVEDESAQNYRNYMDAMRRNKIEHVVVAAGDTIPFGDVLVEVLWPVEDLEYPESAFDGATFVNNQSLTLKFSYGESTMLLAGDLYMAGEKLLIDKYGDKLDVDVLKLNHHGKDTSSGMSWRNTVSAEVAVCEADTLYDIPLLKRYQRHGEVYHTMLDGNICVHMYEDGSRKIVREKNEEIELFPR